MNNAAVVPGALEGARGARHNRQAMRRSAIQLAADDQGNLCVELPRDTYGALAVVLGVAAALMATSMGAAIAGEMQAPAWTWWTAMSLFIAFAAAFGVQALWGPALVFDRQRAAIVRGSRQVVPFAQVSHVELLERRGQRRYRYWVLSLRLADGRRVFLGRDSSDIEADLAAARVAGVLGKPVKHVVR